MSPVMLAHATAKLEYLVLHFILHLIFPDTLLNVFLAIAVDNLANAQELDAAEEEEAEEESKVRFLNCQKRMECFRLSAINQRVML